MIKVIGATIVLAALVTSCGENKKSGLFELKGTLSDSKGETIYLEKLISPDPIIVDSTTLNDKGEFEFENFTPSIGFYRIKITQSNFAMMVLDSTDKVKVTGSAKDLGNTYKVEGSPETKLFLEFNEIAKKRQSDLEVLNNQFQSLASDPKLKDAQRDSISKTFEMPYNEVMDKYNGIMTKKIAENTSMYSSMIAIQGMEPDKFKNVYKALDEGLQKKYANDKNVVLFHEVVQKMLAASVGQEAPDIKALTPDGKELSLSQFKGKYVLIDFWASWCGPCRKEMPNVVQAYAKYKNKGFEIFGVSLDKDKGAWEEAIKKDGITWPQVSDLKYWDSEAAKMYGVQGIPYTLLLDKEGKIIAKNLRGEELEAKLAELFK